VEIASCRRIGRPWKHIAHTTAVPRFGAITARDEQNGSPASNRERLEQKPSTSSYLPPHTPRYLPDHPSLKPIKPITPHLGIPAIPPSPPTRTTLISSLHTKIQTSVPPISFCPMSKPRSELESFDPFAEHPFTRTSGSSMSGAVYPSGIPVNAYPAHVVAASTSPAARSNLSHSPPSPPFSQSPSQSQAAPRPIQSPQPRHPQTTRGFGISSGASTTSSSSDGGNPPPQAAIFEEFRKDSLTPDLDDLPLSKRRTNAWGTQELEESVRSK